MRSHDDRCAYENLQAVATRLNGPESDQAAKKILDVVTYDGFMRHFLTKKLGLDPRMMDFFFGRPIKNTISMFGLAVKKENDTLFLVPLSKKGKTR
jgi:hypothetical protein